MTVKQTKIYRYGVTRVEPALACVAPDPVPRMDPPPATSRKVHQKRGARLSTRTSNTTGQREDRSCKPWKATHLGERTL